MEDPLGVGVLDRAGDRLDDPCGLARLEGALPEPLLRPDYARAAE